VCFDYPTVSQSQNVTVRHKRCRYLNGSNGLEPLVHCETHSNRILGRSPATIRSPLSRYYLTVKACRQLCVTYGQRAYTEDVISLACSRSNGSGRGPDGRFYARNLRNHVVRLPHHGAHSNDSNGRILEHVETTVDVLVTQQC
jgi:hypothetical protein